LELHPPAAAVREGSTVLVVARHLGFWSMNPCRVVHVFEAQGRTSRFGFSYGTLEGHAECGEERFVVEMESRFRRESGLAVKALVAGAPHRVA
jgi:uncharacterized protein (UPF0548 family)